jgi:hypothetical protein
MVAARALAWRRPARVPAARTRFCAMAAVASQAALAVNFPDGRCARGPSLRSAMTCSMMAWPRCCSSAWMSSNGESVKTGLALDLGVAEPRAFLLVAVDPFLRGVDVDEGQDVRAGQQRCLAGEPGQQFPAGLLDLQDVSPGIRAQVRTERGRGADPAEQHVHGAVPQQAHVVDAVGARSHAGDQAADLQVGVHSALAAGPDVLREQFRQAGPLREGHHRHQAAVRHEVGVIERGAGPRGDMGQSHVRGVLSGWGDGSVENYHHPSSEGTFRIAAPINHPKTSVD